MGLRVVVLGAAGVFGSRIATRLAHDERFELLLAGRREQSLDDLRTSIGDVRMRTFTLDTASPGFPVALAALPPTAFVLVAGCRCGRWPAGTGDPRDRPGAPIGRWPGEGQGRHAMHGFACAWPDCRGVRRIRAAHRRRDDAGQSMKRHACSGSGRRHCARRPNRR